MPERSPDHKSDVTAPHFSKQNQQIKHKLKKRALIIIILNVWCFVNMENISFNFSPTQGVASLRPYPCGTLYSNIYIHAVISVSDQEMAPLFNHYSELFLSWGNKWTVASEEPFTDESFQSFLMQKYQKWSGPGFSNVNICLFSQAYMIVN